MTGPDPRPLLAGHQQPGLGSFPATRHHKHPAAAAQARLIVARQEWAGIGTGHGRLRARRVQVVADGRGAAARTRTRWLWLPGPDGSVGLADQIAATDMQETG